MSELLTLMRRRPRTPAAGDFALGTLRSIASTLLNGLQVFWPLHETGGMRFDAINGNTLSDLNTVASDTGKLSTAALFVIANSEQLSGGDSAQLRGGDTDWEIAGWVYFTAVATDQTIFAKDTGAAGGREYRLDFLTATAKMTWNVYDGTNAIGTVTTTGTFSAATWYHVRVYHDSVNDKVGIQIDNGTPDEAATTGAPSSGTAAAFRFGANGSGTPQYLGGRLEQWGKWGLLLSSGELATRYNAGDGRAYPFSTAGVL